ncbi:uncharacterized protein LOC144164866 [Haemaphysalis longicornis]
MDGHAGTEIAKESVGDIVWSSGGIAATPSQCFFELSQRERDIKLCACSEYVQLAQSQGPQWVRMLKHERQQCLCLQEMVEQLAKELSFLKRAARKTNGSAIGADCSDDEDDDEQTQPYDKWTDSKENKLLDTPWLLEKSELLTVQRKLHNRLNALVKRSELPGQAWGTPPEFLLRP